MRSMVAGCSKKKLAGRSGDGLGRRGAGQANILVGDQALLYTCTIARFGSMICWRFAPRWRSNSPGLRSPLEPTSSGWRCHRLAGLASHVPEFCTTL